MFWPPGVKSTMDSCVWPAFCSSIQMYLSDSIVSFPKRMSSPEKPICDKFMRSLNEMGRFSAMVRDGGGKGRALFSVCGHEDC